MHDHPAARWATDALWSALGAALAGHGVRAPATLDRRANYATVWNEPGLVLSQTCGYPYATALRGKVQLVATPVYRAAGCDGARYCSVLLVRAGDPAETLADLRGGRVACNAADSQSGHNALRAAVAPLARDCRFFAASMVTGSHGASATAVASGAADLCAIDCVTWAMLRRYEPQRTAGLRVLGRTSSAPGLPLITAAGAALAAVRAAIQAVMADPDLAGVREALLLEGVECLGDSAYDQILTMEAEAQSLGCARLA